MAHRDLVVVGASAQSAASGMPLKPASLLVAPPDQHLVVRGTHVSLSRGPKENGHRPAIDPLFRSAARWYGPRTTGVVLSGTLDDGAAGLWTIADRGGVAVVQDPETAVYPGMPRAALRAVPSARQASIPEMAKLLVELCGEQVELRDTPVSRDMLRVPPSSPPADNSRGADPSAA